MAPESDADVQVRVERVEAVVNEFRQRFDLVDGHLVLLDQRFVEADQRFVEVDQRFDAVDRRLDRVDQRLETVERRLDRVEQRLDAVEQRLDAMEQRLDRVERRLDGVERRIDELDQRLSTKIDVQMEQLRELVRTTADNYGGVLEGIARDVTALRSEMRGRCSEYERMLADLDRRTRALERQRRRQ